MAVSSAVSAIVNLLPGTADFTVTSKANAATATQLWIESDDAGITLRPSDDGIVHVSASGTYRGERPAVSMSTSGSTIVVQQSCPGRCTLDLNISLPAALPVMVRAQDGGVRATDLTGDLDVSGGDGGVSVDNPAGSLRIRLNDGGVTLTGVRSAKVTVSLSDGGIDARFAAAPSEVTVATDNGGIDLDLPDDASYYIETKAENGGVITDLPSDRYTSRSITATTGNGGIAIRRSKG